MKPRITVCLDEHDSFEMWLNEAGRDLLVRELLRLDRHWDHAHLAPAGTSADIELCETPYRSTDRVLAWGKLMLRPDDWDARHFPHVLTDHPADVEGSGPSGGDD